MKYPQGNNMLYFFVGGGISLKEGGWGISLKDGVEGIVLKRGLGK